MYNKRDSHVVSEFSGSGKQENHSMKLHTLHMVNPYVGNPQYENHRPLTGIHMVQYVHYYERDSHGGNYGRGRKGEGFTLLS